MNESKGRITEVQVGVLTIAAVAVLIVGMMWFKNLDFTRGSVTYFVDFPRVEGMQAGDRVQVRGIRMGEVQGLAMLPEAVRVEIMVEGETPLREDAEITLGEKGIVGEVVVDVEPGTTGKVVPPGYVFKGRTAGTIAAMTDAAGAALAEMRTLTGQVTDLVTEIREQGKVVETMAQANETLDKVDEMLNENHPKIQAILENLAQSTSDLRDLLASGVIDSTLNRTSTTMATADDLLASLDQSATRLSAILDDLDSGEGTAGSLLKDPALYARTDSTLTAVQRLLDEMRRNPKKYFKLNLLDF
ncbi:MCE family protein [bacterium]|nr:MCE family protein [bacterium]PIV80565.1 MAG: hypothetical protein COW53_08990 [bacterium CG17_big_fil_post_rev_8_21_14_2_50_64_8]PJA73561.1 MAG: hypothetical protein CO151_13125 [bacterium CG_4_9_14_3_um_filter_65_15]